MYLSDGTKVTKKWIREELKKKKELKEYYEIQYAIFAKEYAVWDEEYKKLIEQRIKALNEEIKVLEYLLNS